MSVESFETHEPWETTTHPLSAQVAANLLLKQPEFPELAAEEHELHPRHVSETQPTELFFVAGRYQEASGKVWTYKEQKVAKELGKVTVTYPES